MVRRKKEFGLPPSSSHYTLLTAKKSSNIATSANAVNSATKELTPEEPQQSQLEDSLQHTSVALPAPSAPLQGIECNPILDNNIGYVEEIEDTDVSGVLDTLECDKLFDDSSKNTTVQETADAIAGVVEDFIAAESLPFPVIAAPAETTKTGGEKKKTLRSRPPTTATDLLQRALKDAKIIGKRQSTGKLFRFCFFCFLNYIVCIMCCCTQEKEETQRV